MRKPRRLPPPPPPPPRDPIYTSTLAYPRQAASEYGAESIVSGALSTRSLQPINYPTMYGPLSSCATSLSQLSPCCTCSNEPKPVPKQRSSRPRLSISPEPQLKIQDPMERKRNRRYDQYDSLQYRRYLERHIERIFKYLKDREDRRKKCDSEMRKNNLNSETCRTLWKAAASRESDHLRSLRRKITPADFREITRIGRGAMGLVSLVENSTITGEQKFYAMKKLNKSQVFQKDHIAHVMAERDILAEADNEWIVQMYNSFQDNNCLYFILEYVPGGDLIDLLSEVQTFPEDWARFYIAEISLAVQAVHDMGFIHRDIKPDNILIDANGHIKLTDFGLCTAFRWSHDSSYYQDDSNSYINDNGKHNNVNDGFIDDHPTITKALTKREIEHAIKKKTLSCVGSPHYIAPEILNPQYCNYDNYNERLCDWWSVGVILYEMIIGHCPFIDLEKLGKGQYDPVTEDKSEVQKRIVYWPSYLKFRCEISPEARNLIERFICNPEKRVCQQGISEIQTHPFFRGFDAHMWRNIRTFEAPYRPLLKGPCDTSNFKSGWQANESLSMYNNNGKTADMNDFTFKRFAN